MITERGRTLALLLALLLVAGCGSHKSAVKAYGPEKFAKDVLEFRASGKLNPAVQKAFKPKSVTSYLNGDRRLGWQRAGGRRVA